MRGTVMAAPEYVLGHSTPEQQRLDVQGGFLRPFTERLLRDAGVGPGMRVLDLGCGTGDVSCLAAELVGPTGAVLGVDRSPGMLATAGERARERGLSWVRFLEADVATVAQAELSGPPFDALVGRLVLMYLTDPSAVIRRLAGLLRPGGLVAFADFVAMAPRAWPQRPLYMRCIGWLLEAFERSGARTDMGLRLHETFLRAGLPRPDLRFDGVVIAGPDAAKFLWVAETVRSVLPTLERFGIVTAEEVGVETLADRLLDEATVIPGAVCGFALGGAWARIGSPRRGRSPTE